MRKLTAKQLRRSAAGLPRLYHDGDQIDHYEIMKDLYKKYGIDSVLTYIQKTMEQGKHQPNTAAITKERKRNKSMRDAVLRDELRKMA